VKPKLFGSSGIRGLANIDITHTLAQRIGLAVATINEGCTAVVGRDARLTGPILEAALTSGINAAGGDVLQIGLVPTPVTAWTLTETGSDTGIAITASHNPPPYNGFKVFSKLGLSLTVSEQLQLEEVLENVKYRFVDWNQVGITDELDAIGSYSSMLADNIEIESEYNVALDCFCGATSTLAPLAFSEFPLKSKIINAVPDGKFPAGDPEPTNESLQRLGEYIKLTESDFGFGFDGDGDRMMPVGSDGKMVNPDRILAAYAGYVVDRNNGGVIVTHVGASMSVEDMVRGSGGKVVRTPVGDAFVSEAMINHDAVFGGEPVGAWIFPEHHMCPAGVMGALKIIEALEYLDLTMEEFIESAPEYPINRIKIMCPNQTKQNVMKGVKDNYSEVFKDVQSVNTLDGIRLETTSGWVLIRQSGTEPLIRITVEGKTHQDVESIMEKAKKLVKQVIA